MDPIPEFRKPGLNETRCIVRHGLRFYHGLVVAGVYNLKGSIFDFEEISDNDLIRKFSTPLSTCMHEHPILSALINGDDSEKPFFNRTLAIDLSKHVKFIKAEQFRYPPIDAKTRSGQQLDEGELIRRALEYIVNDEFEDVSTTPPWRVYLLSLPANVTATNPDDTTSQNKRVLIAYGFSHSHGDGASALAFHLTFLNALNNASSDQDSTHAHTSGVTSIPTPDKPLPPTIDSPKALPISWSYLFFTLVKEFVPQSILPSFVRRLLGASSTDTVKPWTSKPHFFEDKLPTTAIHTLTIPSPTITSVLAQSRKRNTKLTGTLHQVIVSALCSVLQEHGVQCNKVITATPIDLRRANGIPSHQMGVMASTVTRTLSPIPAFTPGNINDAGSASVSEDTDTTFWEATREITRTLARAASTLQDQPIGLLRYLSSMRTWHTDKIGKPRETTYELSNIMTFDGHSANNGGRLHGSETAFVEKMYYVQGADVTGHALSVNVVSVRGGDLVIALSWQVGALGLGSYTSTETGAKADQDVEVCERDFISRLAEGIEYGLTTLAEL